MIIAPWPTPAKREVWARILSPERSRGTSDAACGHQQTRPTPSSKWVLALSTRSGHASLSLRDGGGVGARGGGDGDESGGALPTAGALEWRGNRAGFGGADLHVCPEALLPGPLEGVRYAACAELGGAGTAGLKWRQSNTGTLQSNTGTFQSNTGTF
jgi:hypothetical protein